MFRQNSKIIDQSTMNILLYILTMSLLRYICFSMYVMCLREYTKLCKDGTLYINLH